MFTRRSMFAIVAATLAAFALPARAAEPLAFTPEAFTAAQKADKSILVHITAGWCPTCRAQKTVLSQLESEAQFKELVVFDVDFDAQKPIVAAFKARSQSTLIVFKGAKEIDRAVGETDPGAIDALLVKAF